MRKNKKLNPHLAIVLVIGVLAVGGVVAAYSVANNINVSGDYNYYESEKLTPEEPPVFGAISGPEIFQDLNVFGSLTTGSSKGFATTSDKSHTLTFGDLNSYTYFDFLNDAENGSSDVTWTLPATSTMNLLLPNLGSKRTWEFRNASTTGTGNFIIQGGTGVDLNATATTTVANAFTIYPNSYMELTCQRIQYRAANNADVSCYVERIDD